ncbi:MAG: hypothetical protein PHD95_04150 [Candidatus ainarchaeum sp.]|nr:hypothetical protein [Candidatus ainarchaeum sp.]
MQKFSFEKKSLPKLKTMAIISAAAVFACAIFFVFFNSSPTAPAKEQGFFQNNEIAGCIDLNRDSYNIPPAVFESLPKPPKCFDSIMQLYREGKFSDDFFFTKEFFLQPEFYPAFLEGGIQYWKNPVATHWGAVGFGASSFDREITAKAGSKTKTRLFLHSGFGVRSFQGLKIFAEFENPEDSAFAKIKLDSETSSGFLLGPSFPKFDEKWARQIDSEIEVMQNAQPKQIVMLLKTKAPEEKQALEWKNQYSNYYNATDFVGEKTVARITLTIQ